MAARYTDEQIDEFVREPKKLPNDYRKLLNLREKRGHKEAILDLTGENATEFRIIARQSDFDVNDFSAVLGVRPEKSNLVFRLRRYNGRDQHTNRIEEETIFGFHIHKATERYQELGTREDAYAEATDRYFTLAEALHCLYQDCGFRVPEDPQMDLSFGSE